MKRTFLSLFFLCVLFLLGFIPTVTAQNFFAQSDLQWMAVPDHADWVYKIGEKSGIKLQLLFHGMPCPNVKVSYAIGQDELAAEQEGSVTTDANGEAVINLGTSRKACFRDCQMSCTIEGKTYKNHIKVGFSPEKIQPFTQMPADFESFWKTVLDEQRSMPLQYTVEPAPDFSNDRIDCYLVKIRTWRKDIQSYIYGYLSLPKKEGRYPVVISPPGAGVKHMDPAKTQFYVTDGNCIRFEMEIHGIDPRLSSEVYQDISRAFGDHYAAGYLSNGIADRDTYYMQRVYAGLVRAVDYLTTLPAWDGQNILVQGNSQGGGLSLVLAALDPRVTAIAIAHPAISDMAAYSEKGRTGGYPHFGNKYKGVQLTSDVIRTLQYYDAVNFARLVKCPVYMTWGYNDNVCPPTTSYAVWNTLTCPKESYITPINEHWISTETRYRQMRFLLDHCKK
ncbi:MAG: acetylxylan esterase [Bacteroidales bacterium]|nr:acetylxylan esterase [Bacteroidales bacterium]